MGQGHILVDANDETCVLVGVITSDTTEAQAIEYLNEIYLLHEQEDLILELHLVLI